MLYDVIWLVGPTVVVDLSSVYSWAVFYLNFLKSSSLSAWIKFSIKLVLPIPDSPTIIRLSCLLGGTGCSLIWVLSEVAARLQKAKFFRISGEFGSTALARGLWNPRQVFYTTISFYSSFGFSSDAIVNVRSSLSSAEKILSRLSSSN